MWSARRFQLVLIAGASLALGADVAYTPENGQRTVFGYNSEIRNLPQRTPHGSVEVASFGLVQLAPDESPPLSTLHVRIAIHNSSDSVTWAVDLSAITLELGDARIHPTLINSNLGTLPIALVDRTEDAVADVYFPVPPNAPTSFAVSWYVSTSVGVLAERTTFVVDRANPPPRGLRLLLGSGKRWWFDAKYAWSSYYRRAGVVVPRPPTRVFVIP